MEAKAINPEAIKLNLGTPEDTINVLKFIIDNRNAIGTLVQADHLTLKILKGLSSQIGMLIFCLGLTELVIYWMHRDQNELKERVAELEAQINKEKEENIE